MRFSFKGIFLIIVAFLAVSNLWALPPVMDIVKQLDDKQHLGSDISAKAVLTQQKVGQGIKIFESIYYRRDKDDSFLIVMTAPDSDKGNGYLRVGDNFWMYRQNTRTFQHVNRDESISGTDTKGGDLETRKLVDLYKPETDAGGKETITEELLGKKEVYKFTLIGKVNDVTYPKQIYWVEKSTYLPLKVQSFSLSGTLMQSSYYPKYTQVSGKYVLLQGIFVDEFEKGNKTILDLSGIALSPIDNSVFTKGYLENLSK
jgi:hypothetical protein